jgi:hypothetical protein
MVSSSNTYVWPVDDSDRAITFPLTRDAIIFMFLDAGDDMLEVPGVSLEVAEAFEENGIDTVFQLIGLAMIQLGPNNDIEESVELFMEDLLENYGVLDDLGLISEALFYKVNAMMPLGDIMPNSEWFESAGVKTQFEAATNVLRQHPQAVKLQDLFDDEIFSKFITG